LTAASCLCVNTSCSSNISLTDLLSTALGWPATAQDQGRGGGRPLEDAGSFTARERGRSASEVGTGRVLEVGSSTPASVLHAKSQTLEPTVAVDPAQHGAKVDGGSRRPPAHRSRRDSGCAITRTGASTDGHGKGQTTGGFEAFGNVTAVGCVKSTYHHRCGNSLWCEGAEHRWGRREDPPSCSGTCSRRKEAAFGGARIIRVGS